MNRRPTPVDSMLGPEGRLDAKDVVPQHKPGNWIGTAVVLLGLAMFVNMLVTNDNLQWGVVRSYMFSSIMLHGLFRTIELTVYSMILGLALGIVLAVMRLSRNRVLQAVSWVWIWFFRGVPPLVQLVLWFNLASLVRHISIGVPFGPAFHEWDTNKLVTPFVAAVLGFALTESAYAAEMIRAGIQAVGPGQVEASKSLGLTEAQMMRRIVLPQALRIVIPPIGNDVISMLKFTSLVSVLAIPDLLFSAQEVYSQTFQTIPLLVVATIWYIALTTVLTIVQTHIERRLRGGGSAAVMRHARARAWFAGLVKPPTDNRT